MYVFPGQALLALQAFLAKRENEAVDNQFSVQNFRPMHIVPQREQPCTLRADHYDYAGSPEVFTRRVQIPQRFARIGNGPFIVWQGLRSPGAIPLQCRITVPAEKGEKPVQIVSVFYTGRALAIGFGLFFQTNDGVAAGPFAVEGANHFGALQLLLLAGHAHDHARAGLQRFGAVHRVGAAVLTEADQGDEIKRHEGRCKVFHDQAQRDAVAAVDGRAQAAPFLRQLAREHDDVGVFPCVQATPIVMQGPELLEALWVNIVGSVVIIEGRPADQCEGAGEAFPSVESFLNNDGVQIAVFGSNALGRLSIVRSLLISSLH